MILQILQPIKFLLKFQFFIFFICISKADISFEALASLMTRLVANVTSPWPRGVREEYE